MNRLMAVLCLPVLVAAGLASGLAAPPAVQAQEAQLPDVSLTFSTQARERGRAVFEGVCNTCHGLKYVNNPETGEPYEPRIPAEAAETSFGVVPPDLSLITLSRRGGPTYVYALLTGFEEDLGDCTTQARNRFFPGECFAMPNLNTPQDQARDIAVFLAFAAEPEKDFREQLGIYVLAFMAVFTALTYLLYRRVAAKSLGH